MRTVLVSLGRQRGPRTRSPLHLVRGETVSVEAISWFYYHSKSKGNSRSVLFCIAFHCDEYGEGAYPSIDTISRFTGMSTRSIRRHVRTLEKLGELTIEMYASETHANLYSMPGVRQESFAQPGHRDHVDTVSYITKKERMPCPGRPLSAQEFKRQQVWSELHVGEGPRIKRG
jgi:hypothetical protein